MLIKTFTCDRCGEPATEWVRYSIHSILDGMRVGAHDINEVDLCPKCSAEFQRWMEVRPDGTDKPDGS